MSKRKLNLDILATGKECGGYEWIRGEKATMRFVSGFFDTLIYSLGTLINDDVFAVDSECPPRISIEIMELRFRLIEMLILIKDMAFNASTADNMYKLFGDFYNLGDYEDLRE